MDTTVFSDEVFPDASLPAKTIAIIEKRMKGKKKKRRIIIRVYNCFFPQLILLITMLSFAHDKDLLSFK